MRWPVADVATEGVRRLEVRALLLDRNPSEKRAAGALLMGIDE